MSPDYVKQRVDEIFNNLTSVKEFKPDKEYNFIIHSLSLEITPNKLLEKIINDEKTYFSGSIISNKCINTYTHYGLILDIPKENLIIAQPFDIATPINNSDRKAFAKKHKGKIMPLDTLLNPYQTYPLVGNCNELYLKGGGNKVTGIFYKESKLLDSLDLEFRTTILKEQVKKLFGTDAPIIKIEGEYTNNRFTNADKILRDWFKKDGLTIKGLEKIIEKTV